VRFVCKNIAGENAFVDLVVDGQRAATRELLPPGQHDLHFDGLPAGDKRIEIYLPTYGRTTVQTVSVDDDANVSAFQDERPRWVTYGSSLTMCRRAYSPSRAWPAMVASAMGWNLTSLGFGGQCQFDPIVGRTIAALPADVISLCLGINTHGGAYNERTWLAAVTGLVMAVRDAHPGVPLLIFSPMISPPRETTPGSTGLTLLLMRQWLSSLVEKLTAHGDRHVAYVDGLKVFGEADAHMMPDQLHPGGDGIELMGRRVEQIFRERLPAIGGSALM
jgi:hypothetical protein